ncbi:DUF6417 family protein [Streptomyces barringtoniae]|uniref:DUF6417 family protein n=1 Tax=Streptomyces barringtoniae TaxID=2892029 RepID=UPI001E5AB72C|nr:DUF6417 family protein [Streptomyces barringtoniae]MCC5481242.1 DUF6417 family protein [Streptomyces barringtoniae]
MPSRKIFLEALRALRGHEEAAEHGWVLLGMLRPDHHKAVESAAGQGLVELAGREMRAELSVYEGGPVVWAARLTGHGRDVLVYTEASPAPDRQFGGPADGERLVELRRSETDALRLYAYLDARLCVPPADGPGEKVRTARQLGNLWVLYPNEEQIASVAYAFYLRSVGGSGAEANRFARQYGVTFHPDRSTASLRLTRLR